MFLRRSDGTWTAPAVPDDASARNPYPDEPAFAAFDGRPGIPLVLPDSAVFVSLMPAGPGGRPAGIRIDRYLRPDDERGSTALAAPTAGCEGLVGAAVLGETLSVLVETPGGSELLGFSLRDLSEAYRKTIPREDCLEPRGLWADARAGRLVAWESDSLAWYGTDPAGKPDGSRGRASARATFPGKRVALADSAASPLRIIALEPLDPASALAAGAPEGARACASIVEYAGGYRFAVLSYAEGEETELSILSSDPQVLDFLGRAPIACLAAKDGRLAAIGQGELIATGDGNEFFATLIAGLRPGAFLPFGGERWIVALEPEGLRVIGPGLEGDGPQVYGIRADALIAYEGGALEFSASGVGEAGIFKVSGSSLEKPPGLGGLAVELLAKAPTNGLPIVAGVKTPSGAYVVTDGYRVFAQAGKGGGFSELVGERVRAANAIVSILRDEEARAIVLVTASGDLIALEESSLERKGVLIGLYFGEGIASAAYAPGGSGGCFFLGSRSGRIYRQLDPFIPAPKR
jgi:hypothetical protein